MNLITKVNFIKKFNLNIEQIEYLDNLNFQFNYENEISLDAISEINKILDLKLNDFIKQNLEKDALQLALIISNISKTKIEFKFDSNEIYNNDYLNEISKYEISNEDDEDEFIDEIGGLSAKEQRKLQKEAVAKYKELELSQIINEFRSYILKKYPMILNGFDRSIYSNAKSSYWNSEHIFDLWQIPTKLYEKIKDAEYKVEEILKEDINKYSEQMFEQWFEKNKNWLNKNQLSKATKVNIKDFFKFIKVKPSETIVERIKEKYSKA